MNLWHELADALRDATGPSRELDARLMLMLHPGLGSFPNVDVAGAIAPHFTDTDHIGQIIKVIGEKLPGLVIRGTFVAGMEFQISEFWLHTPDNPETDGLEIDEGVFKPSRPAALALCEAFCRAMAVAEELRK